MSEIRWVALLPDPVTGLDYPVLDASEKPVIWVAMDKKAAEKQVKAALSQAAYLLCSVISFVDWEARKSERQRAKLSREPGLMFGGINPKQRCFRCGDPTPTRGSKFCARHTNFGGRRKRPLASDAA